MEAVQLAQAAGVRMRIEGDRLVLEADRAPPPAVVALLSAHKDEIVKHLSRDRTNWASLYRKHLRALEADGVPSGTAQVRSFEICVAAWLNQNPIRSDPSRCLACGDHDYAHDPLLPYGTEDTGHAWLHAHCWLGWYSDRKEKAFAALASAGVMRPTKFPRDFGKNGAT